MDIQFPAVFAGPTVTFEDDRFDYGEQRFITLGLLHAMPVSIVHTETEIEIHVVSFRKATRRETKLLYENIENELEKSAGSEGFSDPHHKRTP